MTFFKRKKGDPDPEYSVIGNVLVLDPTSEHTRYVRLPHGTRVKVVERTRRRDRTVRLQIVDDAGRRGECDPGDVWEHIGSC